MKKVHQDKSAVDQDNLFANITVKNKRKFTVLNTQQSRTWKTNNHITDGRYNSAS